MNEFEPGSREPSAPAPDVIVPPAPAPAPAAPPAAPAQPGVQMPGALAAAALEQAPVPQQDLVAYKLKNQWNGAALWFFMIGGFTALNFVLWFFEVDRHMVLSLFSTWLPLALLGGTGTFGLIVEAAVVLIAAATFGVLGYYVRKQETWALWAGFAIFAADLVVFLIFNGFSSIIDLMLRVFALASIIGSYRTIRNGGEPLLQQTPTPSPIGSRFAAYVSFALAGLFFAGGAWLAMRDFAMAAEYGAPGTGDWGLSYVLYGICLGLVACMSWVGVRMLRALKKGQQ